MVSITEMADINPVKKKNNQTHNNKKKTTTKPNKNSHHLFKYKDWFQLCIWMYPLLVRNLCVVQ